ncbi:receptor-type tyrosine-protein phosphatase H isoform X4 [Cherax quadricarinatus]|uniref:receptor-type tyrosine-protein phosphatase H isoform X4 n=1 Tax=Cherax quadricarinatus TaxID=27406 RepID=UPI00387E87BD
MKLFCSLLQLLLYLAVTGRYNHAYFQHLFYQIDDVYYVEIPEDNQTLELTSSTNSIEAVWGEVSGATYYTISWSPEDNGGTDNVTDGNNTYTITGLVSCTNYTVTLQPWTETDEVGDKQQSTILTMTHASDPPQMLTADEVEDQSDKLTVNWTTPEAPGPLCPVTNYSVTWDNTNTQVLVDSAITSDTHFTISNLEAYTNYNVCVVAINSLYSEPNCTVSQTDQDKPGVPGNLTVDCIGARSLSITWSYPDEPRGIITNYIVTWNTTDEDNVTEAIVEANITEYTVKDLEPCTTYNITLRAATCKGYGDQEVNVTTTDAETPGRPENFQKTSSSAKSLTVSWKEPIELNGELTGYLLTWGDDSVNLPADATNYTMSKLHRKTNYNITLQASTLAGCWGEMAQIQEPTENGVSAGAVVGGIVVSLLLLAAIVILVRKRVLGKGEAPGLRGPIPDLPMAASKRTVSDGDIQKSNLRQYIQYLESDTQRGLEEEFASLQSDSPQNFAIAAHRDYNKDKNRFKNIFPFDNARVKLSALNNKTGSDYINASYILNTNNKAYFIAAQGPKSNTTADFWRMVWEQRVYVIIMLTNLVEKGREKCFHYWPRSSESFIKAGSFTIRNHTEEERSFYIIRFLEISEGSTKRLVKQYHFTGWPDFGAPQREEYLLDFIAEIKNSMPTNGDHLLVHCSAGVGRTGTFIGLWNLIDIVDTDNTAQVINVKKTVLDMREYRPHMVQAADQYLYLFKCITAYIEAPHLWNMDYAGADHIYDNTGYDNEEPIYDNIN